jgi:hypothetical protein
MSTFASICSAIGSDDLCPEVSWVGVGKTGTQASFRWFLRLGDFPRQVGKFPRPSRVLLPMFGATNSAKVAPVMNHEASLRQ